MAKINFYSAWYCPFAQRTWTALEYLGIPYVYKETDPYHKSKRWLKLSRNTGQVPVLQIVDRKAGQGLPDMSIPGSLRSLEYLDETHEACRSLFPTDHIERAEARFWLDQQGADIIPYFYRFLKAEAGSVEANEAKDKMLEGLLAFTQGMAASGPYFFGDEPGVVDFAFAPFALRIEMLLSHYKDYQLPLVDDAWERYVSWWQAIKYHPSFIASMPEPDSYSAKLIEFYLPYAKGGGQEDVTNTAAS
ncbi:MAG: hypothetical protein COA69_05575 [Robiginitomaculum sp.]|nr:MAG: hypothetical protein COA69_05575 [Robiginitomaculum sp.]